MPNYDNVFKAYDVRGVYGEQVDEELAWKIGNATAGFLRSLLTGYERGQTSSNRLIVGRDMRPSSDSLAKALIDGITASGAKCVDVGMVDTPMVYFAINHLGACGGIQVTASHNPVQYNGFKISGVKARPIGQDTGLKEIQRLVNSLRRMPSAGTPEPATQIDLWEEYRKHVLRLLRTPRRMKVVVDASNGMGGKMFPNVFGNTDIEIIPLNFEIGKGFVHPPNPVVEANLAQLKAAVVEHKADFGVCTDGDSDRCVFVDETGTTVQSDIMTALLARHFLKSNHGAMVVYDIVSSRVVAEEIRAAGGVPRRERVGHSFIKKALSDGHGVFAGERSGHFYFRDNYDCDSGAMAFATAVTVLSSQEKPFSELIAPLKRYASTGEINFEVQDKAAKMKEVEETFKDGKIDHTDGVTIQFDDWWCNVRPSNTEPLLRLNLEAKNADMLKEKLAKLEQILGTPVSH